MDPPSKGKPPHLFKHYKDIKTLTNNSDTSLSGYRQRIFLRSAFYRYKEHIPPTSSIRLTHHPSKGYGDYNVYGPFTNHPREGHTSVQTTPTGGRNTNHYWSVGEPLQVSGMNLYWFASRPLQVRPRTNSGLKYPSQETVAGESCPLFILLRHRTPSSSICPFRSDTQALRLIASIPLIQRREKCPSREEKSTFPQWYSSIYARRFKDQVRQSKYPRTQILEPRTQSKLICHSSTTFIPTQSYNLIEITSQSYIAFLAILYSSTPHIHIPIYGIDSQRGCRNNYPRASVMKEHSLRSHFIHTYIRVLL